MATTMHALVAVSAPPSRSSEWINKAEKKKKSVANHEGDAERMKGVNKHQMCEQIEGAQYWTDGGMQGKQIHETAHGR